MTTRMVASNMELHVVQMRAMRPAWPPSPACCARRSSCAIGSADRKWQLVGRAGLRGRRTGEEDWLAEVRERPEEAWA